MIFSNVSQEAVQDASYGGAVGVALFCFYFNSFPFTQNIHLRYLIKKIKKIKEAFHCM